MTRNVETLTRAATIGDAVAAMKRHDIRHLPIVDDSNQLVGLITHRGLLEKVVDMEARPDDSTTLAMPVEGIMTESVTTATPDDSVLAVARTMLDNKFGCLPVVEGGALVGVVAESDFVRMVARELAMPR